MLPITIELIAATNNIHPSGSVSSGVNALGSPVASDGGATTVHFAWAGAATITIEGLDAGGDFQTETVDTPAGETTAGYYTSVTSIVPDANITVLVVRYLGGASTASVPVNWRQTPFTLAMAATQSAGTFNEKILFQYSYDSPNKDFKGNFIKGTYWFDIDTAVIAAINKTLNSPVQAMRATIDGAGAQTWLIRFIQGDNPQ